MDLFPLGDADSSGWPLLYQDVFADPTTTDSISHYFSSDENFSTTTFSEAPSAMHPLFQQHHSVRHELDSHMQLSSSSQQQQKEGEDATRTGGVGRRQLRHHVHDMYGEEHGHEHEPVEQDRPLEADEDEDGILLAMEEDEEEEEDLTTTGPSSSEVVMVLQEGSAAAGWCGSGVGAGPDAVEGPRRRRGSGSGRKKSRSRSGTSAASRAAGGKGTQARQRRKRSRGEVAATEAAAGQEVVDKGEGEPELRRKRVSDSMEESTTEGMLVSPVVRASTFECSFHDKTVRVREFFAKTASIPLGTLFQLSTSSISQQPIVAPHDMPADAVPSAFQFHDMDSRSAIQAMSQALARHQFPQEQEGEASLEPRFFRPVSGLSEHSSSSGTAPQVHQQQSSAADDGLPSFAPSSAARRTLMRRDFQPRTYAGTRWPSSSSSSSSQTRGGERAAGVMAPGREWSSSGIGASSPEDSSAAGNGGAVEWERSPGAAFWLGKEGRSSTWGRRVFAPPPPPPASAEVGAAPRRGGSSSWDMAVAEGRVRRTQLPLAAMEVDEPLPRERMSFHGGGFGSSMTLVTSGVSSSRPASEGAGASGSQRQADPVQGRGSQQGLLKTGMDGCVTIRLLESS